MKETTLPSAAPEALDYNFLLQDDCPSMKRLGADAILGSTHFLPADSKISAAFVQGQGSIPIQLIVADCLDAGLQTVGEDRGFDLWLSATPCLPGKDGLLQYRTNGTVSYLVVNLLASDLASYATDEMPSAMQAFTYLIYQRLFTLLPELGTPHLWRTWHYLPNIHALDAELDQYQQFNLGRSLAFEQHQQPTHRSPVASVLGVSAQPTAEAATAGVLSFAFLAGNKALETLENPRQVSAYAYPKDYGPRSPIFSRAGLVTLGERCWLFIAGTASIVGHQTQHVGDVVAQFHEAMKNLLTVVDVANQAGPHQFSAQSLIYRVYVRHRADMSQVALAMSHYIDERRTVIYCVADICRRDLLVEVEALGRLTTDQNKN